MRWMLVFVAGCASETFDFEEAQAGCTSVTTFSDGRVETRVHDSRGWPTERVVEVGDAEPLVYTTEYRRVAGNVVTATTTYDIYTEIHHYDGFGSLDYTEGNEPGYPAIECTNMYDNDALQTSTCNGVVTTYDPCGAPLTVDSPQFVEVFKNTYLRCQPQGRTFEGFDIDGSYQGTVQFTDNRKVSSLVTRAGGASTSAATTWSCPVAE